MVKISRRCDADHPDREGVTCIAPARYPNHDHHFAMYAGEPVEWANPDYTPPAPKGSKEVREFVAGQMAKVANGMREVGKLASEHDPENSQIAAERITPEVGTRKAQVLEALKRADGGWVDGVELETDEIGGAQGTRRLRELRQDGWDIEARPHPESRTAWQYRLRQEASVLRNFD